MNHPIHVIDYALIAIYLVAIVVWALKNAKNDSSKSYFLADRNMSWPIVGLSLFAASISSSTLIGQSAEGFKTGFAVFNYQWISVLVMVFFAIFFLPFYIKSGVFTMPEFLERRFDKRSRYYFSFITIVGNVFLDAAAALYAGAMIIKLIIPDSDLQTTILVLALITGLYTIPGGLSSAIKAELVQAVILIIGSVILSYLTVSEIGGWEQFFTRFEQGDWLHVTRPMSDPCVPWLGMIVGIPILGFYFWGNNQVMVQRVLSAKSIDHGRKGVLFVGFLYLVTLFIFIAPGLAARAIPGLFNLEIPNTAFGKQLIEMGIDVNEVYPRLIMKLLPTGLLGIVLAAMISALTSTLSATLNSASTLFTIDFYSRFDRNASSKKLVRVGQLTSLCVLIIAVFWAPYIQKFGSLVDYYQEMLSYLAPPVVAVFFAGLFSRKANGNGAFAGLLFGLVMALFLLFFKSQIPFLANLHYLLLVPIIFGAGWGIALLVSHFSAASSPEKLNDYVWSKSIWISETEELRGLPWYKNFRVVSVILILCCFVMFGLFF